MSLIGKTLNQRFYILKSLARGGMGHTYLAEDRLFQARHNCVVKHLDPVRENLPYLDKIKELFDREADTLAKLSLYSNNLIPKLIDRFQEAGELYLVQEFIDGVALSAELTPGKKFDQIATIQLLIQVLTPLQYCHNEGLIHRDLKPDNIMRRRQTGELVLIDFGLVKDMGAGSITRKSYGGTPGYAPEEQQYGLPEPASDVYAVGKIAIQALTGIQPTELRRNPATLEWDWREYCNVTDDFAVVLNRSIQLLASRRYQNAAEVLAAVTLVNGASRPPADTPPPQPAVPARPRFTFQTAKLEIVTPTKIVTKKEIISKPGFFGFKKQVEVEKQVQVEQPPQIKITNSSGEAEYFTEKLGNGIDLEMVYIPAGSFMMGSNEEDNEKPIHRVTLPPFCMGRYTITQQQYQIIMGENPSRFKGDNRPVETVIWDNAIDFCQKLSKLTGKQYTLPSESQWEYACRAGTTTPFCFGETITPDLVNYNGNYTYGKAPKGKYREQTTDVGSFPPNAFGLYDLHGNVWEWCLDTWHENYNGAPTDGSAWIENDNDYHRLRGGSWNFNPDGCRSAYRFRYTRVIQYGNVGFRVVCPLPPGFP